MIAALLLGLGAAYAARDVQVCGQWTPDLTTTQFLDGDGEDTNGDGIPTNDVSDFLSDNTPLKTHGLLYELEWRQWKPPMQTQNSWTSIDVDYMGVGGTDGGCTEVASLPVPAFTPVEVRVKIYSMFEAPGHDPMVVVPAPLGFITEHIGPVTLWSSGQPTTKTVALGSGDSQVDVAIILASALHRESGLVTGLDWKVINADYPGGAGKIDPTNKHVWVGEDSNVRRMLHEMGHVLAYTIAPWIKTYSWRNRELTDSECPTIEATDPDPDDGSTSHSSASDEATSAAVAEGLATYYAAQTVNLVSEGDCFIAEDNPKDWDHDWVRGTGGFEQEWYSCDIAPAPQLLLSDGDYWADECGHPWPYPPSGTFYSIASEYDWLRGFWDLDTQGYTYTDILTIFAYASPDDWVSGSTYDTSTEDTDRPYKRMDWGAAVHGAISGQPDLSDDWEDNGLYNGMFR